MPFLNEIKVTPLPKKNWRSKQLWILLEALVYQSEDGTIYSVPEGFIHDFASIPRIFHAILPTTGPYSRAAILHDYTHDDKLFLEAMLSDGTPEWLANLMYSAVSIPEHITMEYPDDEQNVVGIYFLSNR